MAVAERVAHAMGVSASEYNSQVVDLVEPPGGWASPWLVGLAHEHGATAGDRSARGAWYTPRSVVEGLVDIALVGEHLTPRFILDPTCGGGAFLLAALNHLVSQGVEPKAALDSVAGMDIDPGAVRVASLAVSLWAASKGCEGFEPNLSCGDALVDYPGCWPKPDAVMGNPPFASPLRSAAADPIVQKFREERPSLFGPYADTAACHLVRSVELTEPGGVVCLIQPVSVLSGRDTEGMRNHFDSAAPLEAMWCAHETIFDAGVRVVAPVLSVGGKRAAVRLGSGTRPHVVRTVTTLTTSWSALAAEAFGVPSAKIEVTATLGDLVEATAGFRDEHYGLAAACTEQIGEKRELRITTVGSIDPLFGWWGHRPMRFGGKMWNRPVVQVENLEGKVRRWVENQLKPKVLLPTQSKVLEPLIDQTGDLIPATPVLAIHADEHRLHHVAAVLLAPPVVAWALRQSFGSAMSLNALKLSATDVRKIPLPPKDDIWDEAAEFLASADTSTIEKARTVALSVAELMMWAYGADPEVFAWYESRFPVAK